MDLEFSVTFVFESLGCYKYYYLLFFIIFRQEAFMENYFASQRDNIFRNVEVLIYVFDVESRELGELACTCIVLLIIRLWRWFCTVGQIVPEYTWMEYGCICWVAWSICLYSSLNLTEVLECCFVHFWCLFIHVHLSSLKTIGLLIFFVWS